VNGGDHQVEVDPDEILLDTLRDRLGLTGAKKGCATGDCGACTVVMEGRAVTSCLVLSVTAGGKTIQTVEGLAVDGVLHPVQQSFIDSGGVQCGYCTPGLIMATVALLDQDLHPSDDEMRIGLSNNLCRCTGYGQVFEAVRAAGLMLGEGER
jgi:carbon-monoxide dehydrogenase small subunit